jgi:hypothetical protein
MITIFSNIIKKCSSVYDWIKLGLKKNKNIEKISKLIKNIFT